MTGQSGGEVPRFRSDDEPSNIPPRPQLNGEHGALAGWFERALRAVQDELRDVSQRLSRMEGAEAEQQRWREKADEKLDRLLARPSVPEPAEPASKRPWWADLLTERTMSLLAVVAMAAMLLWFAAADRFGLEQVDRSIDRHIGRDAPAK